MTQVEKDLRAEEWALLGIIHRQTHGGPRAPDATSVAFSDAYATLVARQLIEHSDVRSLWVITDNGEALLRAHYT